MDLMVFILGFGIAAGALGLLVGVGYLLLEWWRRRSWSLTSVDAKKPRN